MSLFTMRCLPPSFLLSLFLSFIFFCLTHDNNYNTINAKGVTVTAPSATTNQASWWLENERLKANESTFHAFVHVFPESDRLHCVTEKAEGQSILSGMSVAVKDLFHYRGDLHTTAGMTFSVRQGHAGKEEEARVLQLLRAGGACLVGLTRLTEGAWVAYPEGVEAPVNPIAPGELWQGDSSSGSGVAVAAGFVRVALGTDTSGSLRGPSLANALVGKDMHTHKATSLHRWPRDPKQQRIP